MAQIYFVNIQKGKSEYSSAKRMDASTFKSVFGKQEQKNKHSIVEISAAQYKQIKEGKALKAAEIGAVEGHEVVKIANENELLRSQVSESNSEIANLQRQLAELQKGSNEKASPVEETPVEENSTEDKEATPAKTAKKK